MNVYCVSYDLDEEGAQDYEGLTSALKRFPAYCHAHLSVWLVATEGSPRAVLESLKPYLDRRDKLMVLSLEQRWSMNRRARPVNSESSEPGTIGDWLRRWLA